MIIHVVFYLKKKKFTVRSRNKTIKILQIKGRTLLASLWLDDGSRMDLLKTPNTSNTREKPWAGCPVSSVWQFCFWNSASLYYSLFPALENMPSTFKKKKMWRRFASLLEYRSWETEQECKCGLRFCLIIPEWRLLFEGEQKPRFMMISSNHSFIKNLQLFYSPFTSQGRHSPEKPLLTHNRVQKLKILKLKNTIARNYYQIMISNFKASIPDPGLYSVVERHGHLLSIFSFLLS